MVNKSSPRIRALVDSLACPIPPHIDKCVCLQLHRHYGSLLFKCQKRYCQFFHKGFKFKYERDKHMKHHGRLFKCPVAACDFAQLGFGSRIKLEHHQSICHPENVSLALANAPIEGLQGSELEQALDDSIDMGRPDYLRVLLETDLDPPWEWLMERALRLVSVDIPKLLDEFSSRGRSDGQSGVVKHPWIVQYPMEIAVLSGSVEIIEWLISTGADIEAGYKSSPLVIAARAARVEAVQLLLEHSPGVDTTPAFSALMKGPRCREADPHVEPIDATGTAQLLGERGVDIDKLPLTILAKGVCDTEIGKYLIDLGADVNRRVENYTPLYLALVKGSAPGVKFARMLLENGADPTIPCSTRKHLCERLKAARNMHKFLGITWDELVHQTWESRASTECV